MEKPDHTEQLLTYRKTIDNLDAVLIHTLAERFRCTNKIGKLKAIYKLPEVDKAREESQLSQLKKIAQDAGLDQNIAEQIMRLIINEVIIRHSLIKNDDVSP